MQTEDPGGKPRQEIFVLEYLHKKIYIEEDSIRGRLLQEDLGGEDLSGKILQGEDLYMDKGSKP